MLPIPSFLFPPASRLPIPAFMAAANWSSRAVTFISADRASRNLGIAFIRRSRIGPLAMLQIVARCSSDNDDMSNACRSCVA